MKKKYFFIGLLFFLFTSNSFAQVGIGTTTPDNSAMLEIQSTEKGILIPRMTELQRTGIPSPVEGLLVYQIDNTQGFYYYDGSAWNSISAGGTDNDWIKAGNYVYNLTDSIGIGTETPGAILDVHGHIWQTATGYSVFLGEDAGKKDDLRNRYNVFAGYKAGYENTSGSKKIAIGAHTLTLDSINSNLIAIGDSALYNNRTITYNGININGYNNIGLGSNSLFSKQTGFNNLAVGNYAAYKDKYASQNIVIGDSALYNNGLNDYLGQTNHSSNNIAIGVSAGKNNEYNNGTIIIGNKAAYNNNSIGLQAIAIGHNAMEYTGGGRSYSVAIGNLALRGMKDSIQSGSHYPNTAVGYAALYKNYDGSANTAIGYISQKQNFDNNYNTSLGYETLGSGALDDLTVGIGNFNTAVGVQAMMMSNGGNHNVAMGYHTLLGNRIGNENVAIGTNVLQFNTKFSGSTAIGYQAMGYFDNTNSNYYSGNTALGYQALRGYNESSTVIHYGNTAIGSNVLTNIKEGDSNTALGSSALKLNTDGSYNCVFGVSALQSNLTGNYNTVMGIFSGNNATGSGNIFLGAFSGFNETGDNKLYIENSSADADNALIYGEFDNDMLRINGQLQIHNIAGTGFAFPTVDGNINQIMQTDGNGQISWVDAPVSASGSINIHSDVDTSTTTPTNGQVLKWDGSNWTPADDSDTNTTYTGSNGIILSGTDFQHDDTSSQASVDNSNANVIQDVTLDDFGHITALSSVNLDNRYYTQTQLQTSTAAQVHWNNLTNVPLDLQDGDDDTTYAAGIGLDLTGTTFSLNSSIDGLTDVDTSTTAPTNNQVLAWDGTNWVPKDDADTDTGAHAINDLSDGINDTSSVFLGTNAGMNDDASSNENVGLGTDALKTNTIGSENIAIGFETLINNDNGNQNTAIGRGAGLQSTGSGNVFIGYRAGNSETGDNKLYIANSATTTPLIYGNFDTDKLTINGTIAIKEGNPGAGKVLTSDITGNATWQPPSGADEINDLDDGKTDNTSVFLGGNAGASNAGADGNTGVGLASLNASTGINNSALGMGAIATITSGNDNTALGYFAGIMDDAENPVTSLNSSIFIGSNTKALHDSGDTNEIVIGTNITGLGSNTVIIGDTNITKTALNGKVGVGTTDPKSALQVNGGVQVADDTDAASADKEGTIRYRTDSNNSYVEICVKTDTSTYAWVIIHQETW